MPTFRYMAVDRGGQAATGALDAPSERQAIALLSERGLFVTQLNSNGAVPAAKASASTAEPDAKPAASWSLWGGVSLRQRGTIFRQLATSLQAGLPLLSGLQVVKEQAESDAVRELLASLAERVQAGDALSQAMSEKPDVFTPLHVSMVRAGETAGVLDETMEALADFSERELEVREQIRSAATYPVIVLLLAAVSVLVLLIFVIPKILETVTDTGGVMPLPTRILMGIGDFLGSWWGAAALLAVIAGGVLFHRWTKTPEGRFKFDRFKLRIPVLGETLRKIAVGRFARTLATLSRSGIQILEALRVLRDTLGNEAMARTIDDVSAAITQGQSIAEPLRETGQFPPLFIQVIALGERTGRMDELLLRAANAYEKETTAAIQRTMTILPAVFIVFLAALVGFILVAVLLPIVGMQTGI